MSNGPQTLHRHAGILLELTQDEKYSVQTKEMRH